MGVIFERALTYVKEAYPIIQKICIEKHLPCRNLKVFDNNIMIDGVLTTENPMFEGTKRTITQIEKWLMSLKDGYNEIVFHPGYFDPQSESSLNENREREKDAENIIGLNKFLLKYNIKLISYLDLKNREGQKHFN